MADVSTIELDHCRELAMQPGNVFEFTSRFLPAGKQQPLLALYALRQSVSSIPHSPVDDEVKWAKLKWWSEELVADPALPSRHPVLRALWLSGARANLDDALLLQLVSDAVMQIDAAPDSDENALFERMAALGATEIQLELALDNAEIDPQSLGFLGAATSLFRLVSDFAANHPSDTKRLPLNLLAKYNVSSAQLEQRSCPVELTGIIAQLAQYGLDWFSKGMSGAELVPQTGAGAHLQLRWAMEKRRLAVITKDAGGFIDAGKRYGPADAWFAWRFLRSLK